MHKNATKCNETLSKWCKNKHGASKIIDTFETYQGGMRLGGFGGGYGGISAPKGGMGAPESFYGNILAPPGDSWPPWSLHYLVQVMVPMEKKEKMEMAITLKMSTSDNVFACV
jgi:hypothetical protein